MFQADTVAPAEANETLEAVLAGADVQRMMLLTAGDHLFALPLAAVREILPARPYTPLPGAAATVCGLINVRGRIVTVLDLPASFRLPRAADVEGHTVVLLEVEGRLAGLAVGDILRIMDVDRAALDDSAEALRLLGLDRAHVLGVGELDGRLFVALDPHEILRPLLAQHR